MAPTPLPPPKPKNIGLIIGIVLIFGLFGFAIYWRLNPRLFSADGDACVPTEDEKDEKAVKKTYELDEDKACIPTECVDGYTLDSGKCIKSTDVSSSPSSSSSSSSSPSPSRSGSTPTSSSPSGSTPPPPSRATLPTGEVCDPDNAEIAANPQGKEYRYDDNNVCKLAECTARYKLSADLSKCEIDPTKQNTNKVFDCSQLLAGDDSGSCYNPGSAAGIRWNWGQADASTHCNNKIKYYEVTVKSNRDPDTKFRTKLPPGSSTAGLFGLPPTYMDTDLTFTVDPIDKNGNRVLDVAKEFIVKKDETTKCGDVGVPTTEAYYYWNENDNLLWGNWDHYCGHAGNNMEYIIEDPTVNATGHLWSSGRKANCQGVQTTMTRKAKAGYYCYDRIGGFNPQYKTGEEIWRDHGPAFNMGADCYFGNYDGSWWKNGEKGLPVKSTL